MREHIILHMPSGTQILINLSATIEEGIIPERDCETVGDAFSAVKACIKQGYHMIGRAGAKVRVETMPEALEYRRA